MAESLAVTQTEAQTEADPPPSLANNSWNPWDSVHLGLDAVGLIPAFGELADGTNALIYVIQGNYVDAGLSAAAMIPIAGTGATAAKLGKNGIKAAEHVAEHAADIATDGKKITDAVEVVGKSAKSVFKLSASGPHNWGNPAYKDSCKEYAEAVLEELPGGRVIKIFHINRLEIPAPLPKRPGQPADWFWKDHYVVVNNGKVYDAFTGDKGQSINDFKKEWKNLDD